MKPRRVLLSLFLFLCLLGSALATQIPDDEVSQQQENFLRWWGTELEWKLDELPTKASVEDWRIPYSGSSYLNRNGGTTRVLRKYDQAFHGGQLKATTFEQRGISSRMVVTRSGLFGRRVNHSSPGWHGHCNGWTAAAIRHAAPRQSVVRNGMTFTPSDIRGLLAELYMHCDIEFLGGVQTPINPGTLHVILANWIGRGSHPVGMDTTAGEVAWNYPVFGYTSTLHARSQTEVDVEIKLAYANTLDAEMDDTKCFRKWMEFRYRLNLDEAGKICGGVYLPNSERIDMLWVPLQPRQGGQAGNLAGNPYLDSTDVLEIWRESVPTRLRYQWLNIDPLPEDLPEEQVVVSESQPAPARQENHVNEPNNTTELSTVEPPTHSETEVDVQTTSDINCESRQQLVPGDQAQVVHDSPVLLGRRPIARVLTGMEVMVVQQRGEWTGIQFVLHGRVVAGWVRPDTLKPPNE